MSAVYYTGESSFEVKVEADSNDITEHPHDDKPRPYLCTVCDKRFTHKGHLNEHKQIHTGDTLYSCTQCEKRFATQQYLRQHMNVHSSKYKCAECGKCFKCNRDLTVHSRIHSGEKSLNLLKGQKSRLERTAGDGSLITISDTPLPLSYGGP